MFVKYNLLILIEKEKGKVVYYTVRRTTLYIYAPLLAYFPSTKPFYISHIIILMLCCVQTI